ncbi:MAG: hypothetical protein EOO65_05100 [Methanosarcinales archaeon]|nr:MAG: hypothetical protein EOO65_05100 [Methanosarcinales archaeon]
MATINVPDQQQIVREQDAALDALHDSIVRVGTLSAAISMELHEQSGLMDDTEAAVAHTTAQVGAVNTRMRQLVRQAGGCGSTIIIALLLLILFILVLIILAEGL